MAPGISFGPGPGGAVTPGIYFGPSLGGAVALGFIFGPGPGGEIENFTKMTCIESMSKVLKIYCKAIEHYHHLFISL